MVSYYIPSTGAADWQRALANPEKHWRDGYSAKSLAERWQSYSEFPPEVAAAFSQEYKLKGAVPLLGLVEHQIPMPGYGKPSQCDLFVLAKRDNYLISVAVEGKVNETFGETLDEWDKGTPNRQARLRQILEYLHLSSDLPRSIRYQLLHRTAAAVIEAERYEALAAVLLVHSFSPIQAHLDDFQAFVRLYDCECNVNQIVQLTNIADISLYAAWIQAPVLADEKYR